MCQCAKKTTDRPARARRFGKVVKSEIDQKGQEVFGLMKRKTHSQDTVHPLFIQQNKKSTIFHLRKQDQHQSKQLDQNIAVIPVKYMNVLILTLTIRLCTIPIAFTAPDHKCAEKVKWNEIM